ncbi:MULTISPECIES: hypothetical protein [Streptosporangium]|uniref:Uncharacterized protein n=1 Tax=Streptosporangium brasiliense TaxID=47480 RepID=A0ABT9RQ20_9ACTN|nr:hypothetical protein [Streptosporangium brasiliense]MDP9870460.1 hypothetical protein [Streptosporangium brasiliense]
MSALYPAELREWSTKFDYTTVVLADHFNTVQDELTTGLQRTLGLTPQIARNDPGSTPFTLQAVVDWISSAPSADVERIIQVLEDSGPVKHNFDPAAVTDALYTHWPQWAERFPHIVRTS